MRTMNLVLLILTLHLVCVSAVEPSKNNQQKNEEEKEKKKEEKIEINKENQQVDEMNYQQKQQTFQNMRAQRIQRTMQSYEINNSTIDIDCGGISGIGTMPNQIVEKTDTVDQIFDKFCKKEEKNKKEEVKENPNPEYTSVAVKSPNWRKYFGPKAEYENKPFEDFEQGFERARQDYATKHNQRLEDTDAVGRITYVFDDQELQTIPISCAQNEKLVKEPLAESWTLKEISLKVCGHEREYTSVYLYIKLQKEWQGQAGNLPNVAKLTVGEINKMNKKMNKERFNLLAFSVGELSVKQKKELMQKLDQNRRRVRRN